jgi:MYXO-CTERM domain-containing protein
MSIVMSALSVAASGLVWLAHADPASSLLPADHDRTTHIFGGDFVEPCGWPTTVSMEGGCTGTLVHPQVVVYAAHCGAGVSSVQFGESITPGHARSVPVEFCRTYPSGGPGGGNDFAFCVLEAPQDDIAIVPILFGCETSVLTQGREVTVVGFGLTESDGYGEKKAVTTTFNGINGNEAYIGGGGEDSCQGDSGGPVYVQLPDGDGGDGTWRVFGITSYGGNCGEGGYYSLMHIGLEWFETESGIDLTPCHDIDGTWAPSPDCMQFPRNPANAGGSWDMGCDEGAVGGASAVCGEPFDASDDVDAPVIAIVTPRDGDRIDSVLGEPGARITIEIDADDGGGYGIDTVELLIDDQSLEGGVLTAAPYHYPVTLPPGTYKLDARAIDFSGNVGVAQTVYIGVDMDPMIPGEESSSGGEGEGGEASGESSDDASAGGDTETTMVPRAGGDPTGCGCRSTPPGPAMLVLGALALLRRRRLASRR